MKRSETILIMSLLVNFLLVGYILSNYIDSKDTANVEIIQEVEDEKLSDWDLFTLALIKVESEYKNEATSSVGAKGYFQMTPIYVKEVNRIYGTNYTFSDVMDFDKAYQIFDLMQQAHNPDYDMKKALELHNGKHSWYNKRVFKAMDEIKVYEEMRNRVKNI